MAATLIGAAIAATTMLSAAPASAKASDGWVRGYDNHTGDWGDEGVLSKYNYSSSNATCLWQKVLWAEGAVEAPSNYFDLDDVDGHFGSKTSIGTQNLQARWGLTEDSTVGPDTFGWADGKLHYTGGSGLPGKTMYLEYRGFRHTFDLKRNTEGKYLFTDRKGDWRQAGYDYHTCG
ncbi:peptidoglycan-binding domain-containing protein [Streptomyces violaceus]